MDKIDKEKFINDIKRDLGIKDKKDYINEGGNKFQEFHGFDDLGAIFSEFFNTNKTEDILNNPNNIYVTCKTKKDEANTGCEKFIKIKRRREDNTIIKEKLKIKISKDIKSEQQIILPGDGNRNNSIIGNLVVKIIVN